MSKKLVDLIYLKPGLRKRVAKVLEAEFGEPVELPDGKLVSVDLPRGHRVITVPTEHEVYTVPKGTRVLVETEGKRGLLIDAEDSKRAFELLDHAKKATDLGATSKVLSGDVLRLALLRGLAQLEAERDALANPEPETAPVVVVLGGRPWPYVGQDDAVSLTEAGEEAAGEEAVAKGGAS